MTNSLLNIVYYVELLQYRFSQEFTFQSFCLIFYRKLQFV